MQFKVLPALVAILSASAVTAQITAKVVVTSIDDITDLSQDATDVAQSISSNPFSLPSAFLRLANSFGGIVTTATKTVTALEGDMPKDDFAKDDQSAICDALTSFVKVHQNLLEIVIGKAGLLTIVPFVGQPVAAVLRALEGVVDTLAGDIISLVPTCAKGAKMDIDMLQGTLEKAISAYSN
ncbi:uncharacterized protein F5Z01DRAFT_672115 [Emericellopsis atlantica]|uniref:Cell wall galactomannoprotein n=1 Tax=Emericellopsis atlantica TaxID=2614577 RepID=A0A9P8CS08_9HYPO|nr:uncharacterized protein F5Z01DRAFT_672115 [Emericellopsis atlantica]KAG9256887.1 hypothetical protein F5Z01DRAFT_672115 [Emericellopsis atlantica]